MFSDLEKKLGYTFRDKELLRTALTHSSYANEHRREGVICNERLEFLGDAILGLIVAEHLYEEHPDLPEGELTRLRADLVCENSLAEVAGRLELGKFLRLGKGESSGGGNKRPSMLADAVEATLAASYLDGGMEIPRRIIAAYILGKEGKHTGGVDYKTKFQELVQRSKNQRIEYALVKESGPDHDKRFFVEVSLNGSLVGAGEGSSKKRAEQAAARSAIEKLFPGE